MRTTTRPALTALAVAGALALGACSGGGASTTSAGSTAGSSSTTSSTSSAATSTGTTTSSAPSSASTTSSADAGSGSVSAAGSTVPGATFGTGMVSALQKAGSGRATMTVTQGSSRTSLQMEFAFGSGGTMRAHATMSGGLTGATGTEVVIADGATYVKLPKAVNGRTWLRTTTANGVAPDPASIAKSFSGAKVVYVGQEGDLRHYTVTMGGASAGTVQAYLDDRGRPSRFTGKVGAVGLDATYSDWGTPVTVTPPPASQVTTTMG